MVDFYKFVFFVYCLFGCAFRVYSLFLIKVGDIMDKNIVDRTIDGVWYCNVCHRFWLITEDILPFTLKGFVSVSDQGLHCTNCVEQPLLSFDPYLMPIMEELPGGQVREIYVAHDDEKVNK